MLQFNSKYIIILLIVYLQQIKAHHGHQYYVDYHCDGHYDMDHMPVIKEEPSYRQILLLPKNDAKKPSEEPPPVLQSIFTLMPRCQPGYIWVGTKCRKQV